MNEALDNLPSDAASLRTLLLEERAKRERAEHASQIAQNRIVHLEELLRSFQRKIFGPSSEQWNGQPCLFNECEAEVEEMDRLKERVKSPGKTKPGRRPLPPELPRKDVVHELPEGELTCDRGERLTPFGEEVSEQLAVDVHGRHIARNSYSRPILGELRLWLDRVKDTVAPKSLTGKALSYLCNEWARLVRFLDDGSIPISNQAAENSIRPFAVGRRNWLFSSTRAGAEASSILYSLVETAKANGREPYAYFSEMIEQLPACKTAEELIALLPYHLQLQ